jgi:K+-transporting ATPase KdpF subunit
VKETDVTTFSLVLSILAAAYLLYAMLRPEKF